MDILPNVNWSNTEQKIWDILKDGKGHHRTEFHSCLWDEMGERKTKTIITHMVNMRRKLQPHGLAIVCVFNNGWSYRLVRLISSEQ